MVKRLATVLVLLLGLTAVGSFASLWLGDHKGSGMPLTGLRKKLEPLLVRYHKETGQWPTSWAQIHNRLCAAPEYDYPYHCNNHPWEGYRTASLEGSTFKIERDSDGDLCFHVGPSGWPVWIAEDQKS